MTVDEVVSEYAQHYKNENNNWDIDLDDYEVVEEGDWTQDGKYQYCETIVKYKDVYISIQESRSGSYHTDWFYNDTYISPVERKVKVVETVTWLSIGKPVTVDGRY